MTDLHVLRVFVNREGEAGNPLGVFLRGRDVPVRERQVVAAELGFSETVFVDHVARGEAFIAIFTPGTELAFAGHPTVGTAWLLREANHEVERLLVPAGTVETWVERDLTWIRARPEWVHEIEIEQLPSPADVDALAEPPAGLGSYYAWAWIDQLAGVLRARYFAPGLGMVEDEATGAAAVVMGARLGTELLIRQGRGSALYVRPGSDGTVEVGGRVVLEEVRRFRR